MVTSRPHSTTRKSMSRSSSSESLGQTTTAVATPGEHRGPVVVRHYELYNRCSDGLVVIGNRRVNATGQTQNVHSRLRVETVGFNGRLRIRSYLTGHYLCFNKGQLTVKRVGNSNGCVLKELITDGFFTEFQSTVNLNWFVGFNQHGHRMPGNQWQRNRNQRRCYQFVKMDKPNDATTAFTNNSPAINMWKAVRKMPT